MTNNQFTFDLVTPEKIVSSQEVEMAVVPGVEGDFGVLSNHAPTISSLKSGVINIYEKESAVSSKIFVSGGIVEVSETKCAVLATDAYDLAETSLEDANTQLKEAKDALDLAEDDAEKLRAEASIKTAENLIAAISA